MTARDTLYIVVCAAPAARKVQDLVVLAQDAMWDTCVIATPQALKFLDVTLLEQLTGHPVRSEYKHPDEPDVLPRADAIIVYPATFNTINKWALGITDTLALGLLCEYLGLKKPILAAAHVSGGLDLHPIFLRNIAVLREWGIHVLFDPERKPGQDAVLNALHKLME